MNTVERIKNICKDRHIAISKLERECGFANAYIGQLKKGTVPDDRLRKIADYFGVSVEYLLTGEEPLSGLSDGEELDLIKDVDELMKKIENGDPVVFKYNDSSISEENKEALRESLLFVCRQAKIASKKSKK